jgi:hypothetical protein
MANWESVVFFDTFKNSFLNQQHRLISSFCFFLKNKETKSFPNGVEMVLGRHLAGRTQRLTLSCPQR